MSIHQTSTIYERLVKLIQFQSILKIPSEFIWSEWTDYGDCSTTCGNGQQIRTRDCLNPHNNESLRFQCNGENKEKIGCKIEDCDGGNFLLLVLPFKVIISNIILSQFV